jgi:uncharacterized LabA/DUF88 family protein
MRPSSKTTAILVDGSNLHAAYTALGLTSVDFKRAREYFGPVFKACYFTALPPKDETSTLRPMVDFLEYNEWTVYQKEWKQFTDAQGVTKTKGNMDVEMAVVAMRIAPCVTHTVLFTGDGDFQFLVRELQQCYNHHVTVVSTIKSRPAMCADLLRRQADTFIDLVDLHAHVGRVTQTPVDAVQRPIGTKRFRFREGN